MSKLILLLLLLGMLSACATQSANEEAQTLQSEKTSTALANTDKLKVGMSRAEAEQLLGEPSSTTDTADASVLVWIFDPGATKAEQGSNNPGMLSKIGGVAATIAGIFSPIAGVATSVGSQVYNVSQSATSDVENSVDRRSITIEFKADKIVSIQRARLPSSAGR